MSASEAILQSRTVFILIQSGDDDGKENKGKDTIKRKLLVQMKIFMRWTDLNHGLV